MRKRKERLTVTVDQELVAAGNQAVRAGRAASLSAWVNLALLDLAHKERRLQALADAVAAYEAGFGAISGEELDAQRRADRAAAIVVRGRRTEPTQRGRRRRAA